MFRDGRTSTAQLASPVSTEVERLGGVGTASIRSTSSEEGAAGLLGRSGR
jgi:hypothetical protein